MTGTVVGTDTGHREFMVWWGHCSVYHKYLILSREDIENETEADEKARA